jgi:hypothetical protein
MSQRLDENLTVTSGGAVVCARCETPLGDGSDGFLPEAIWRERPTGEAPRTTLRADPARFTERPIALRQAICPNPDCLTLLLTEVVPTDEPRYRRKHVA